MTKECASILGGSPDHRTPVLGSSKAVSTRTSPLAFISPQPRAWHDKEHQSLPGSGMHDTFMTNGETLTSQ